MRKTVWREKEKMIQKHTGSQRERQRGVDRMTQWDSVIQVEAEAKGL